MKRRIAVLMLACTIAGMAVGVVGCSSKAEISDDFVSVEEDATGNLSADKELTDGYVAQTADGTVDTESVGEAGAAESESEDAVMLSGRYSANMETSALSDANMETSAWKDVDMIYTFYEDGTFEFSDDGGSTSTYSGIYTIEGNKLKFTVLNGEEVEDSELDSSNILMGEMIIDGDTLKYNDIIWEEE